GRFLVLCYLCATSRKMFNADFVQNAPEKMMLKNFVLHFVLLWHSKPHPFCGCGGGGQKYDFTLCLQGLRAVLKK
ncbi:MAG TPA: hypothetical protein VFC07_15790, partial [Verrucomicrobiae bacterium]|nr:hypothetical protein [Verrucomicrobiae bacterium]